MQQKKKHRHSENEFKTNKPMKTTILLALLAFFANPKPETPADTPVKGAWQMVKSKYDKETDFTDYAKEGLLSYKMFTGTRWSGSSYNTKKRTISGTNGGTYTISGNQYVEKVEYYSWDTATEGKSFTFTMTIENGMLHQFGYIEYKENKKYLIDEWYKRVD